MVAGNRSLGVEVVGDDLPRRLAPPVRRLTAALLTSLLAASAVAFAPAVDEDGATVAEGCRLADIAGTPEDPADDVTICEQQLFVRAGDAPLSNAASAVFSTEAPSAAPVGGAGLGTSVTDIAAQGEPQHGLEVNGTFTGPVDTIDVEVYLLMPNGALGSHGTTPTVELDGFDVAGSQIDATVTPGPNNTAVATFRITGVLELWGLLGYDYDPSVEHTLRLNLSPFYFGDDGAYLYDGTDVPSNVVLNAAL